MPFYIWSLFRTIGWKSCVRRCWWCGNSGLTSYGSANCFSCPYGCRLDMIPSLLPFFFFFLVPSLSLFSREEICGFGFSCDCFHLLQSSRFIFLFLCCFIVSSLIFDENILVSASYDGSVQFLDPSSLGIVARYPFHDGLRRVFPPSNFFLCSLFYIFRECPYSISNLSRICDWNHLVVLKWQSSLLVFWSSLSVLNVWSLDAIYSVMSVDPHVLLSSSRDRTVRLFDLRTRQEVAIFPHHGPVFKYISFFSIFNT